MHWWKLNMTGHFLTLLYQFEILTFSSTGSKLFEGRETEMRPLPHVRASKYTTIYEVRRKFILEIFHNFQKTCRFWPRPDRWPWPLWPWPSNFEVSSTCPWHRQSVTLICVKVTEKNGIKVWHLTLNISKSMSRSRSRSRASRSVLHVLQVCRVWPVCCRRFKSYSVPKFVPLYGTRNVMVGNTRAYINTRVQIVYIGVDTPNSSTLRRDRSRGSFDVLSLSRLWRIDCSLPGRNPFRNVQVTAFRTWPLSAFAVVRSATVRNRSTL